MSNTFAALHDMTGKVAVVTGGSRGIGRAIVQTLAEAGADVVIASRKLDACEAAAGQVRASTGRQAVAMACHVGRWGDCDRLIAETLERTGRLDVLVSNAGMSPLYDSLDAVSEELFDKTLAVNLKGPFRLAVLAATHMAAHDGGSIINIGTTASLTASVTELPYACAKAGLNALTVGLAEARGPNWQRPGPLMFFPADAIVDAETGCLLRLISYAGDQPAAWWELRDVGTEPGDPGEFRLHVPPGVRVVEETGNPFTDATAVMPGVSGAAIRTAADLVRRTAGAVSATRSFLDGLHGGRPPASG